jgi:2-methylisocitrate lyase-like PEP mutase family enzyme
MPHSRPSIADKRRAFHKLHEAGCFAIPNPWDVGSARFLQGLGFKALATTSSGFAWSHGHRDGGMSRDRVLDHLTDMVEATNLPINADFESGFAPDAAGVAESVRLAVETGVAGLSIEDSTGDASRPIYELHTAVARIRAARKAIDKAGGDTLLVGRAECFLHGQPDIGQTIHRLKAYADAGADCLYAPGVRTPEHIGAVVAGVAPKPVNLLMAWPGDLTCLRSRLSACGGSASAERWRARPGAASCGLPS